MDMGTIQAVPLGVVITIALALVGIISSFFWNDRKYTQKRIDDVERNFKDAHGKLEHKLDSGLGDINIKLEVIKSKIDTNAGLERPATVCRQYVDTKTVEMEHRITELIKGNHEMLYSLLNEQKPRKKVRELQ